MDRLAFVLHRSDNAAMPDRDRAAEKPLHILVIDPNRIRASIIEAGLSEAGHEHVTILGAVPELMRRIVEIDPDVIFIDLENPNRDQLEHMLQVSRAARRPVAMFVDRTDQAATEAAIEAGVSAYIVDGLKKERVKSILDVAVLRFNAFDRLQRQLDSAQTQLAERGAIERAKGILMRTRAMSEAEAYAALRKTAMNQSRRIVEVAESLLLAEDLLNRENER